MCACIKGEGLHCFVGHVLEFITFTVAAFGLGKVLPYASNRTSTALAGLLW